MLWDLRLITEYFPKFYTFALLTLQLTALSIVVGLVLGLIGALLRISKFKILSLPAKAYIWFVRGTPLLLQLWLIYYGLADIINIPRFPAAVLALGVHNGAYIAEIFRGAILSIERGQKEAALSLGMTSWQSMKRVILPQAFKRAVPPLGNQFIIALKDTSLASTIGATELMMRTRQIGSSNFIMFELLMVAAIYYLIMTSILTFIVAKTEKRLSVSDHRV